MGRHPCERCRSEDWDYTETHCPNDACEYFYRKELCLECFKETYSYRSCEAKECMMRGAVSVSRIIVANVQCIRAHLVAKLPPDALLRIESKQERRWK